MRILILSDIHANPWALAAVERDAGTVDYIICGGDTVSYGPGPQATVQWIREHQAITVRGNHDHAVAFRADPRANPAKQSLALTMRDWTRARLDPADLKWLTRLPVSLHWEIGGVRFALAHATPMEPLYDYRLTPLLRDAMLDRIIGSIQANVLVVGHTHLPMVRSYGDMLIVNPGSAGQPLDADPRASYAIWQDGEVTIRRVAYDRSAMVESLRSLPIDDLIVDDLIHILQEAQVD